MVDALHLQGMEGALHRRVVEAIALAAHRGRDPRRGQGLPARLAGVLDPAVGVTDQARGGALPPDRRLERLHRDLRVRRLAHRPAHDLAGVRGSRTAAGNSQPSQVAHAGPAPAKAGVGSPSQTPDRVRGRLWFGAAASKARPMRLGAMGWPWRLSVVRTRRGRAAKPCRPACRISRATRWRPTRRPRTCRAACTRGVP